MELKEIILRNVLDDGNLSENIKYLQHIVNYWSWRTCQSHKINTILHSLRLPKVSLPTSCDQSFLLSD